MSPVNGRLVSHMTCPSWTPIKLTKQQQAFSQVRLEAEPSCTTFEALCRRFPHISAVVWLDRFTRGLVLNEEGRPLSSTDLHCPGTRIRYCREIVDERPIPCTETILYQDEHLVVADKPHFLPISPTGPWVKESLLNRLMVRLDNPQLSPIHRLDRGTAGVVMFSTNPRHRNRYQALFRERKIEKTYEALAPPLSQLAFPYVRRTRIIRGDPFFLSQEVEGEPNSETTIEVIKEQPVYWHYRLYPHTGKKHQLRLHMATLGAPILNDPYYPTTHTNQKDDYTRPMALIARTLKFTDPISGAQRHFVSDRLIGNIS